MSPEEAKTVLFGRLASDARETYWEALSRFLRFEINKAEFERLALPVLGAEAAQLHNGTLRRNFGRGATRRAPHTAGAGTHSPSRTRRDARCALVASSSRRRRTTDLMVALLQSALAAEEPEADDEAEFTVKPKPLPKTAAAPAPAPVSFSALPRSPRRGKLEGAKC